MFFIDFFFSSDKREVREPEEQLEDKYNVNV